jgi:hypothetical protein
VTETRTDWDRLHSNWVAAGFDPARFWNITPREVEREMTAARKRREIEADERMSLAWYIAAFTRVEAKKFPKLKDVIGKRARQSQPSEPQSPDVQLANMKAMFLAFGGDPEDLKTIQ